MVWPQSAQGIAIGSVYALLTLGLPMVYGVLRIPHEAHAGIYALGASGALYAFRLAGGFWPSLAAAMLACALAGPLVERECPEGGLRRLAAGAHEPKTPRAPRVTPTPVRCESFGGD